jgi:hypothetical protein
MNENDTSEIVLESQRENRGKKKKVILVGVIAVILAVAAIFVWYFQYKIPHDQAAANYNEAVEEYNAAVAALDERNTEFDDSLVSLKAIIGAKDLPLDETLLVGARAAIDEAQGVRKDKVPTISKMPSATDAINSATADITSITSKVKALGNYGVVIKKLRDAQSTLEPLIKQFAGAAAKVTWVDIDKKDTVLRFVAEINNPNAEALTGVALEWVAFDKNDAVVGTYANSSFPVIPANSHIYYVGGAGSAILSGVPDRVELTVKNNGILTAKPTPNISVSKVKIKNENGAYSINAYCKTDTELETSRLDGQIIVKDKKGQIIAAEFWDTSDIFGGTKLPKTLPAGGKFKLNEYIGHDLPAVPNSAEVYMYYAAGN